MLSVYGMSVEDINGVGNTVNLVKNQSSCVSVIYSCPAFTD